jgi:nitrite reductase/ring-hydroxylating ferredoxin subunit/uncharacterized membrane protein
MVTTTDIRTPRPPASQPDLIERWSYALQRPLNRLLGPTPIGKPLRSILNGTVFGHPIHPALNDLPPAAWTAALAFDLLSLSPRARRFGEPAADASVAVGLVGALGAAVTGLADWAFTDGDARRAGMVHGLGNFGSVGLYAASLALRVSSHRSAAGALGAAGFGLMTWSSILGADMTYRRGIGVNHAAFQDGPDHFTTVARADEVPETGMMRVDAEGVPVVLVRVGDGILALGNTCPHMGCSLAAGTISGETLTCHCHGSRFDVRTGRALLGPTAFAATRYDVRVVAGQLQVRRAD